MTQSHPPCRQEAHVTDWQLLPSSMDSLPCAHSTYLYAYSYSLLQIKNHHCVGVCRSNNFFHGIAVQVNACQVNACQGFLLFWNRKNFHKNPKIGQKWRLSFFWQVLIYTKDKYVIESISLRGVSLSDIGYCIWLQWTKDILIACLQALLILAIVPGFKIWK